MPPHRGNHVGGGNEATEPAFGGDAPGEELHEHQRAVEPARSRGETASACLNEVRMDLYFVSNQPLTLDFLCALKVHLLGEGCTTVQPKGNEVVTLHILETP